MAIRFFSRGWLASAALLLTLGVARPAAADDAISEEAKLYFRNGVELIQGSPPNYQDAYYQFKLAHDKSKSWKVLGNLGLCAFKLERDGEALDAYNEYLKSGGSDIDPEERKQLERDVLLITGNSAAVSLVSSVTGVEVIDARQGSTVPLQTYKFQGTGLALRLRAGTHTLTATTPDGKQERWEVVLSPGKTVEHKFSFGATATPVAAAPVAAQPAAEPMPDPVDQGESGGSGLRTVGFITAGVGAAALVGGVVTGIMANSKEKDATGQCSVDKVCPTAAETDFDSAASLATTSTVLYIGGGVLAAAGIGMIVFGGGGKETAPAAARAPRLELSPYAGPTGGGIFASGSF